MRIVHVTESMGAGVLSAIETLARVQSKQGHRVSVLFISRFDTPSDPDLADRFGPYVELVRADVEADAGRLAALARAFVRSVRNDDKPDVIHVHSSRAGAVVRPLACALGVRSRTIYSPHGFAFLRQDMSIFARGVVLLIEAALAIFCKAILCVSEGEAALARRFAGGRRVGVLENYVPLSAELSEVRGGTGDRPVVYTVGRWTAQKSPERFVALAEHFAGEADFVWIGGAEEPIQATGVEVTGWLSRADALSAARQGDIFVLLSRWEGMPIALVEAQLGGSPAIVSDVVGNRDVVEDGRTGFVVGDDRRATEALSVLLRDESTRRRMSLAAREAALARFDLSLHETEWSRAYAELTPNVKPGETECTS